MSDFTELWFRGLDEKEKESFVQTLKFSPVLRRLLEILDSFENEIEREEADYTSPAWAYKQADANGSKRTIRKIKKLLTENVRSNQPVSTNLDQRKK